MRFAYLSFPSGLLFIALYSAFFAEDAARSPAGRERVSLCRREQIDIEIHLHVLCVDIFDKIFEVGASAEAGEQRRSHYARLIRSAAQRAFVAQLFIEFMPFDFIRVSISRACSKSVKVFSFLRFRRLNENRVSSETPITVKSSGRYSCSSTVLVESILSPYQLFASRSRHACIVRVRAAEEAYAKSDIAVIRLRAHIELSF